MKTLMLAVALVVAGGGFLLAADDAQAAPPICEANHGSSQGSVTCRVGNAACVTVHYGDGYAYCTP